MSKKKILIVEDEREFQDILKIFFERDGLDIYQAFDLVKAEEIFQLESENLKLVVMDGFLNKQSSENLVRKIHISNPNLPIIAFSGDENMQKKLVAAGCSHRVQLKADSLELIKIVRNILKKE